MEGNVLVLKHSENIPHLIAGFKQVLHASHLSSAAGVGECNVVFL